MTTTTTTTPSTAPSGWTQTSYEADDIAAGANGDLWLTKSNAQIYRVTSRVATLVGGAAKRVTVDPNGVAWVVNATNNIYRWSGSGLRRHLLRGHTQIRHRPDKRHGN